MKYKTLDFNDVRIEPLEVGHIDELVLSAASREIWQNSPEYLCAEGFKKKWLEKAFSSQEKGTRWPFVVFHKGACVGSSSYYSIDFNHKKTCIGYTWLNPTCWGKGVNRDLKKLMLSHAFESGFNRVSFNIDHLNLQSQKAVTKIGAVLEGRLRQHMIRSDGTLRDTLVYSVLRDEFYQKIIA